MKRWVTSALTSDKKLKELSRSDLNLFKLSQVNLYVYFIEAQDVPETFFSPFRGKEHCDAQTARECDLISERL